MKQTPARPTQSDERFGISARSYQELLAAFRERPKISTVVLFGSRAIGTARNGSDIDIAITGDDVTPEVADELAVYLNNHAPIPYHVDVVARDYLDHAGLIDHIRRVGRVLYRRPAAPTAFTARHR